MSDEIQIEPELLKRIARFDIRQSDEDHPTFNQKDLGLTYYDSDGAWKVVKDGTSGYSWARCPEQDADRRE